MAWASARYKTATAGGSWVPADMNGVQDQYLRATGLLQDDLDAATLADILGVTQTAAAAGGAKVRRGKSIIATTEVRTNVAYGTLTTPDQVASLVLPTDGLIAVLYDAIWQESVAAAGRAAIFIGANQMQARVRGALGAQAARQYSSGGGAATDMHLCSAPMGLVSGGPKGAAAEVTTGTAVATDEASGIGATDLASYEVGGVERALGTSNAAHYLPLGGICYVWAAAGTYTVSVQFKSSSGSVTVKNRRLWAWTIGF